MDVRVREEKADIQILCKEDPVRPYSEEVRVVKKTRAYLILTLAILLILSVGVLAGKNVIDSNAVQHSVTAPEVSHAAVSLSQTDLPAGKTLEVTVLPEHGYRTAFVWMEDASGNRITMTEEKETEYKAVMPDSDVTVAAVILPQGSFGIRCDCSDPETTVQAEPSSAAPGEEVRVTVQLPEGKRVQSVEVSPAEMKLYTVRGSGVYTFTMPEEDVTVQVSPGTRVFSDVEDTWYENYVYAAVDRGYMAGVGPGLFQPEEPVTRAQAVQSLYAMAGYPETELRALYADIPEGTWYAKATVWAADHNILNGFDDNTFRPDLPITRQQMATAIHRYASNVMAMDATERSTLAPFQDRDSVAGYASASVKWAVSRGILDGITPDLLEPEGIVPRSQLAAMLLALNDERPSQQVVSEAAPVEEEPEVTALPSEDLEDVKDNAWYLDGVNFTVSHGYMSPIGEHEFMPKGLVTRQQATRILYALDGKPAVTGTVSYADLTGQEGYTDAVIWATQHGFITGYFDATFRPDAVITRQQFVAMLYKYAFYKGYDLSGSVDLAQFADGGEVVPYALEPMRWAIHHQIVQGSHGILGPAEQLTRAQVACMIHTFGLYRNEK